MLAVAGLALVAAVALAWERVVWEVTLPVSDRSAEVVLQVPPGATGLDLLDRLEAEGLFQPTMLQTFYVQRMRVRRPFVPGEYRFGSSSSLLRLFEDVEAGRVVEHTVGLRPGMTASEISEVLQARGFARRRDFLRAVASPALARVLGVPSATLDGFLYPDVYALKRGLSADALAATMVTRFYEVASDSWFEAVNGRGHTTAELVRIAGLLQVAPVEAKEWAIYARLLWTRHDERQTLHPRPRVHASGATVLFGPEDPPGPVSPVPNPGEYALRAAAYPAAGQPRYLVRRASGELAYCADLECFWEALGNRRRPALPAPEPLEPRPSFEVD